MKLARRQISSRQHALVKRIRAMVRSGLLLDEGEVLLETPNLIEDAARSGTAIKTVLLRSDAPASAVALAKGLAAKAEIYYVDGKLFSELSTTENNPGILALAAAPAWAETDLFSTRQPLIVVLAGIQDPGNLGTILRAAEAFGATGVIATRGTVSQFNAKAIRAGSGTILRLPTLRNVTSEQVVGILQHHKIDLFTSVARNGKPVQQALDPTIAGGIALALGAEGSGLPPEIDRAGTPIRIPMARQVESLNVATAAAILLYEMARVRQQSDSNDSAAKENK